MVKVRTMPSRSRITLWGSEKKVLTLLRAMVVLLARRVEDWFMAYSSFFHGISGKRGYFGKRPWMRDPRALGCLLCFGAEI